MKINVEFTSVEEFDGFLDWYRLKLIPLDIEKNKKNIKSHKLSHVTVFETNGEATIPSSGKIEFKDETINVESVKKELENCHILYPGCGFPDKRHYHKNINEPLFPELKSKSPKV